MFDVVIAGAPCGALVDNCADTCFLASKFADESACDARGAQSATLADGSTVELRGATATLTVKLAFRHLKQKF